MSSEQANSENHILLSHYRLISLLGEGGTAKVYMALDNNDNSKKVAIKIYGKNLDMFKKMMVMTEVQAMDQISHQNVLQKYEYGTDILTRGNKSREVTYLVTELASGGEFFDIICHTGALDENYTRYFAKQLLAGLSHCHAKGIVHRDLKLDNLLLDKDYNLKIADFGFSAPLKGPKGDGLLKTQLGTPGFVAPEIIQRKKYNGAPSDLFAVGVILFTMLSQASPFSNATPKDNKYKLIINDEAGDFWSIHQNNKQNEPYSKEFKHLITQLIQYNPEVRPSIDEVLNHSWLQGPVPTQDEVYDEFNQRKTDLISAGVMRDDSEE